MRGGVRRGFLKANELTPEQIEAAEVAIIKWRCNPDNEYSLMDCIEDLDAIGDKHPPFLRKNTKQEGKQV